MNPDYAAARDLAEKFGIGTPITNGRPAPIGNGHVPDDRPLPVTADVLSTVRGYIGSYVVATGHQLDAISLWVAHAHTMAAETTPYISIRSAEKQSGKTKVLEACEGLVPAPWRTENISVAALAHAVDSGYTLLLDEVDTILGKGQKHGPSENQEARRGILNSGYRMGGSYTRMAGVGANMYLKRFNTFGPKMLAGIGELPGTLEDRSIAITLRRRTRDEKIDRLRVRQAGELAEPIREALARWAPSVMDTLRAARPELPDELDDRAQDCWEPLFAIANLAGGDWPERVRKAALELSTGEAREDESLGVRLLTDIYSVMEGEDRLSSAVLVKLLNNLEDAPWNELGLATRTLAWRLKPYGIRPKQMRLGAINIKGYERADLIDAWKRYVPAYGEKVRNNRNIESGPHTAGHPKQMDVLTPNVSDRAQIQAKAGVSDVSDKTVIGEDNARNGQVGGGRDPQDSLWNWPNPIERVELVMEHVRTALDAVYGLAPDRDASP